MTRADVRTFAWMLSLALALVIGWMSWVNPCLDDEIATNWGSGVECCVPAPPVIEFDRAGRVVQSWGGVGGPRQGPDWPENEHGLFVDYKNNVWVAGNGDHDGQVLKFSKTGQLLLRIGRRRTDGEKPNSNDTTVLFTASNAFVHPRTNEVFISDGYGNRRVIVFDADTGAYKRHWGAYGEKPGAGSRVVDDLQRIVNREPLHLNAEFFEPQPGVVVGRELLPEGHHLVARPPVDPQCHRRDPLGRVLHDGDLVAMRIY